MDICGNLTIGGDLQAKSYIPALTINSTGGGNAHNNMQPFIVFHYLIKF
jgi:microcystin-dependent protein